MYPRVNHGSGYNGAMSFFWKEPLGCIIKLYVARKENLCMIFTVSV